jgi:hypothetical protein
VSTRRKLKRTQQKRSGGGSDFASRTSAERFKTPGSEKLWAALLGWPDSRVLRMWLLDAVHDAVRLQSAPGAAVESFAARRPDLATSLSADDVAKAMDLWANAGAEEAGHFHYLSALLQRLGLSEVSAEELAADWNVWTGLGKASPAHKALLASLAQAEQAAALLHETTQSEPVRSTMGILRSLWLGLAYGDASTLRSLGDAAQTITRPE